MSNATRNRRPLIEALEPRLLFSATADIAVFDDGHSDGQSLAHAAERLDLVSIYMPDAPPIMESQGLEPDFDADPQADIGPSAQSTITTLVFVDTGVADYQTLVEDIRNHTDANSTAIIYIDATKDGVAQITDYLAGASGISAIHVISHSVAGSLQLGNQVLNENNIGQYAQQLAAWKTALGEEADILLYGCDLAANQSGINLLRQLSDLTGADIAASNDLTGTLANADWDLEIKVGQIEAASIFTSGQSMAWEGALADVVHLYSGAATNEQVISIGGDIKQGVQLTSSQTVDRIQVMLANYGTSSSNVQMTIYEATYNGPVVASASVSTSGITNTLGWINFDFAQTTFNAYTVYWVEFKTNDGADNLISLGYINSNVITGEFVVNNAGDSSKDMAIAVVDRENTPPQGFNWAIDTPEDTPLVLTAANFGFSDPVDNHNFAGVVISSLPSAGSLTLTGNGLVTTNQFITIADINAGKLVFTPAANENATNYAQIGFQVRDDGGGTDTDPTPNTLTIDVSYVNDDPVNTVPAGPITTAEDTTVAISGVSISDVDDYNLWDVEVTLSVSHGVLSVSGGSAAIAGSGTATVVLTGTMAQINATLAATLNYTPTSNYFGADVFTIVTNDKGAGRTGDFDKTDTDTVAINVTSVNDAPIVANAIPDQSTNEESLYSYTFPANTFNDVDGNTLTYTATLSNGNPLPAWLNFNAGTRTFSGVPDDGDIGTISIRVTANDGFGGTVNDTFDLTVVNINDLPFVNIPIPNQSATEDAAFSYSFPANTFGDGDVGTSFTYTATLVDGNPLPGWLSFDSATRTFSGTPANDDVGTLSVKVIANDGAGATVSDNFDIVIANTNDAPTVANQIPNQTATENALYNYTFPINTFHDQDVGDTLTYTAQRPGGAPLPAWLTFDAATRTFSGTPSNGDVGNITIEVIANDGTTTVSDFFDLQVDNVGATNVNYESSGPATNTQSLSSGVPLYQSFAHDSVGATYTIDSIILQIRKDPSASAQTITVSLISSTYNGTVVASDTKTSAGLNTVLSWEAFDFSGVALNDNQIYFIKVETTSFDGLVSVGIHNTNVYPNGSYHSSTGTPDPDRDLAFQVSSGINNNPQIANPIPNQNATEDAAFNFQFAANTFSDADGDTLTYSATMADGSALPGWLNFDAATRTFSGTPVNADVGTISIKVTADDTKGGTPATDTFDLVIANTNDAPTIANEIPNQNATEDAAFNFTFAANTFSDVDVGDTLSYSAQLAGGGTLPAWLSFDAATRTFSGTPTNDFVGTVSIDVIANDGNGGTVTDTFDIVVANTNDAPTVANAIPNQNATEDAAFNFQFAANTFADPDVGDTLTYSAQLAGGGALPAWLSFNSGTRTFSGTPTNDFVGTVSIDVIASDGNGGTVTDTFDIVVANTNDAPTVANAIPNQNATEDAAFNFQFAANTFNDVDVGDTLTYSAQLAGGGALPAWLSFNAGTRTFSGTPANGDVGTVSIDVIANDGNGGTVTDTFDIAVANTNDAPTVANAIPNQNATEDAAFSFQFAANTFADPDVGDTLTYSAQLAGGGALPAWLSFNAGTRTFSGTPANGDVGTVSIDVIANDGNGGTVTDTFDIVVANTNDAPTVANAIPNQIATEDAAFNFQFAANTFADPDVGDTLTYSAQLAGGGALPAWLSFDAATRTFSGTPTNAFVGTVSIDVIANDGNGGTVTDTFDIVVANTNDAPTVANAIPNQNATEGAAFNFQFAANTFADPDVGDTLTYSAQLAGGGALPAWLSFNAGTRTFSGTPANGDVGTVSIDVIANDGNGGTVTDTFDIVVANTNDAPTVANAIPNQNATEDAAFNFQFAANTFADPDVGDTLTYSAQLAGGGALPAWLSFDAATRTFSGTPTNEFVGTVSIDVIANDGNGGTVTDTFDIVVANTNDAPTVANAIPNQNATEDAAFSFQFAANTFADPDVGDTLTYSAQLAGGGALPAWLSFNVGTRTFSGTPTNEFVGTVSIDVIANDGNGGTVTDTFDIVVANTNDAPTVAFPIADQSATENTAFNFTFGANVFADPDVGDTLTYSAQLAGGGALPAWLSFNSATRSFSGTPALGDVGSINIEVTANDGQGGTVSDVFALTVTGLPVNAPPFVQSPIADQVAAENQRFDFSFPVSTFVDPEGDPLRYSAQLVGGGSLPAWLSFDAATRSFSGTPTAGDVGSINVLMTASDANGGSISDSFVIVVNNVNDAPVLVNPPANQTALEDLPFSVTFPANMFTDADTGTTLVYSAQLSGGAPLPNWLVFDAATLSFSGTPTQTDVGNLSIHIIASDGIATATAQFELTVVEVNDVPETTGSIVINNVEDAAGDQVDLWALFSDEETATRNLVFSVVSNSNPALVSNASIDLATGKLQLNYGANQFGSSDLMVRGQDEQGAWVDTLVRVNIASVNDVPVSSGIADINVKAGTAPQQMNLRTVFSDVENGTALSWTLMQNSNNSVVPNVQIDPATGLMTLSFASQAGGESVVTLRAQDSDGAWVETSFKVTVAALEKPPVTVPPVEPPLPPAVPPTTPPATPPTTEGPKPPKDGAVTEQPEIPSELPNQGGNSSLEPLLPDSLGAQQIIVETGDSNRTDTVINDKSSRDFERAEEALSNGNIPLTTLTASPNLAGLIAPDAGFAPWEEVDFDNEVRRLRAQMDEAMVEEQDRRAVVAGLTFSVTTGLLVWSLRASSLLLTMMSMLPLWRGLDPLPILDEVNKKKKELEQQRKDREREDKNAKEVGYLFDHAQRKESGS